ncbi:MAG: YjbF family lipoprotein [Rhodoferax sp.]|uniref:YjbF family lipoprotein n=1 Tax=Rhodoferax sp. TaxID=50421 RepID=UPI002ACDF4BB|nr:YjbF family lipoprotein [Rhodoferax sp.]MDZ7892216.1 YjbF family lipoprotein [Rhodoferax sp.]
MLSAGCASSTAQQALVAALQGNLAKSGPSVDTAPLNPAYRYLRVDVDGAGSALLVLGYVEPHPAGAVEVWYSSLGEVLKTQQGRIVGTVGLPTDWSSVSYHSLPVAWSDAGAQASAYERVRSVLPSYRFGVKERVLLAPVPQADFGQMSSAMFAGGLRQSDVTKYRWYQEQVAGAVAQRLPISWYALGQRDGRDTVVFSRQCLAPDLCMNLQLLPVRDKALNP